jgi:threonine/homoserine/homoserine lactone efflux protein
MQKGLGGVFLGTRLARHYSTPSVETPGPTAALTGTRGERRLVRADNVNAVFMTILDLIKATVACGGIAFLIYSYPQVSQVVLIGFLSLLWLAYARKTVAHLRRR